MTVISGPVARPRFLRWSLVVLALMTPFVAHAIWDYVEARRVKEAIDEISRRGEPTSAAVPHKLYGEAAQAERVYRAAGALASGFSGEAVGTFAAAIGTARRNDDWPDALVEQIRSVVARYDDALQLADKAAALKFEGFQYSPQTSRYGLRELRALLGLRAILRAVDGDSDGAAAALYSDARTGRPLEGVFWRERALELAAVLERIRPSSAALAPVADAWAEADRDDLLKTEALTGRATLLDRSRDVLGRAEHLDDWALRPVRAHVLNRQLRSYETLIAAASYPWPENIDRYKAVATIPWNLTGSQDSDSQRHLETSAWFRGEHLATIRSVRAVIAIERYRRDHSERPPATLDELVPSYLPARLIDPFTGTSLVVSKKPDGYSVYSVAHNRRDDGGRFPQRYWAQDWERSDFVADVGVQIKYRP